MKFQPKILFFLLVISTGLWMTSTYWEGWILAVISVLLPVSVFFISIVIFLENRNPSKTLTWLVVLATLPILGFIFYILLGRPHRRKRVFRRKGQTDAEEFAQLERYTAYDTSAFLDEVPPHQTRFFLLANRIGNTPISLSSRSTVLRNGEETFTEMIKAMERAQHHIHLEYYIVRDDTIGRKIQQILIKKTQEGVEVRFIIDSVGCFQLSHTYIEQLRRAGVHIHSFNPVTFPILNSKVNFRNHRKITIVDGEVGFVGGLNIGDEYLGKHRFFEDWRDTHLKIEQEAVRSLQMIFLKDWYHITGEKLLSPQYLSPYMDDMVDKDDGGLQIIAGGPDQEWEVIKKLFFSMITSSRKRIDIASPYLIPDEDILSALKIAALSGVQVNIILPSKPDKRIVFWASRSYFTELLEAGINIHLYRKGFLHSKVIIVDQELASVGSANMDMRSFHLNFEVNAFLYRTNSINKLVRDFEQDLLDSDIVMLGQYRERKYSHRVLESVARLFSPLL